MLFRTLLRHGPVPTGRGRALPALVLAALLGVGASSCRLLGPFAPLQVEPAFPIVLLMVDALRADRVDGPRPEAVSPNLLRLAADGVLFTNAIASAPKTVPSVPQTFTSRYFPDLQHDVTLMSVCRDSGYEATAAFVHNPYVTKWLGRVEPTFGLLGGGEHDAVRLTDDALAWLDARRTDRFALYVHYLDAHTPYRPPRAIAERFVESDYRGPVGFEFSDTAGAWAGRYDHADRRRIEQLYDAAAAGVDLQVGRVLEALREQGLYDDALIVVTSDHGEEFWEHGGFFHGHTLYDELLRVPLVVKFPGSWRAGTKVDAAVGTIDVLPTVVDLLARAEGREAAPGRFDGESLVRALDGSADDDRALLATVGRILRRSPPLHAVRTASAKLIVDVRDGVEQLFDLRRDPGEQDNLVGRQREQQRLAAMRRRLASKLRRLRDSGLHLRVANAGPEAVDYAVHVAVRPMVPVVNLARFDLEDGDRIEPGERAAGFSLRGRLEPGDHDEVGFETLATDASVLSSVLVGGQPAAVEVCVADEPSCWPAPDGRTELPLGRMRVSARPAPPAQRAGRGLQAQWWMVRGGSEPITPALTEADRERLRALGYAE